MMFNRISFRPQPFMTLFAVFFLIIFIVLGHWQIRRYHYKQNLLTDFNQRLHMRPIYLDQLSRYRDWRFLQLRVKGHYLNDRTMLLENKFHKSRVGYEVVTPFAIADSHRVLLINRGWIPRQYDRELLRLASVPGEKTVTGYIKLLDEFQFILGKNILNPLQWPLVMQKIDIKELQRLTHWDIYPFILRLDKNQADGFVRDWQPIIVLPQRHLAYAIQWFAMALALVIAYFIFSCRKKL